MSRQLGQRQIDSPPFGVRAHVPQDVGQLQRLAQIDGVIAAGGIPVPKYLDAEQSDHRGDPVAVQFQIREIGIALDVQIHLHPLEEFIEQLEAQLVAVAG